MNVPPTADLLLVAKPLVVEQIIFHRRLRAVKEELPSKHEFAALQQRFKKIEEEFAFSKQDVARLQERVTALEGEVAVLKLLKEQDRVHQVAPKQASAQRQLSEITTTDGTVGETEKRPASNLDGVVRQGRRTLQAYLDDFDTTSAECEDELITAFLDGMASRHYRAALEGALDRVGRRWSNVKIEVARMLEDAIRRDKMRKSLDLRQWGFQAFD
ncbi:MAG: hypothetical protein Q9187_001990 [Circinaria calcarea]